MIPANATFGTIVLRPDWLQWLINKALWILINILGYCWYDETPLPSLIFWLMVAMSVHLGYMLLKVDHTVQLDVFPLSP